MPVPVNSGHTWERDPNPDLTAHPASNFLADLRVVGRPEIRAKFKTPGSQETMYSMGVERVAYALGSTLGLPIPPVQLGDFNGDPGAFVELVENCRSWNLAEHQPLGMTQDVVNADVWPLGVVFDIWIANVDRHPRNMLAQSHPPETKFGVALRCTSWLIDHGRAALWPPRKFGAGSTRPEDVNVGDGQMLERAEREALGVMQPEYRQSCTLLGPEAREAVLDRVRDFPEDALEQAVHDVPAPFFSAATAERTFDLLAARQATIATLCQEVFHI